MHSIIYEDKLNNIKLTIYLAMAIHLNPHCFPRSPHSSSFCLTILVKVFRTHSSETPSPTPVCSHQKIGFFYDLCRFSGFKALYKNLTFWLCLRTRGQTFPVGQVHKKDMFLTPPLPCRRLTTLPGAPGTPLWSTLHHQNLVAVLGVEIWKKFLYFLCSSFPKITGLFPFFLYFFMVIFCFV